MKNLKLRIINKIMYFVVNLKYFFRKRNYDSSSNNFLNEGFLKYNIPGISNEIQNLIKSNSNYLITSVLSENENGVKILCVDLRSKNIPKKTQTLSY